MTIRRQKIRRWASVLLGAVGFLVLAFLIYFPGRQTPLALTLATGIGRSGLQMCVDQMEDKAIKGLEFTEDDKRFLGALYSCFAKGGRLTIVLRQSSQMMRQYLSRSGEDLETDSRIFVKSAPVQEQMVLLRRQVVAAFRDSGKAGGSYSSGTFYMCSIHCNGAPGGGLSFS